MAENVGIRDREVQESQDRYRSLFHDNPVPALLIEPESGVIRGANPAASDFYGYSLEELETVTIQGISALSAADMLAEAAEAKHEGRKHYSLRHRMKNGSVRDVEVYSNPIVLRDKDYHYVLIFDVTARRVAQDQLEKALEEKVVLLKEIHHRVKNNLQIVASLLNLQIRYIKDPEDRELFKTSQNRVYSMSLTHELLYQAADLSSINMGEYGQRLISYLREAHQAELRILTEFGHFLLPLDKALPCGLILNELVTNAIKYASPAEGEDTVKVTMSLRSEARGRFVQVEVIDHGPGLPPGLDPPQLVLPGIQPHLEPQPPARRQGRMDGGQVRSRQARHEGAADLPLRVHGRGSPVPDRLSPASTKIPPRLHNMFHNETCFRK